MVAANLVWIERELGAVNASVKMDEVVRTIAHAALEIRIFLFFCFPAVNTTMDEDEAN
jgi:hypothetical protein